MPVYSTSSVPTGLKIWFVINGIVDLLFAIPLLIAPRWMLFFFGIIETTEIPSVELLPARLIGAAVLSLGLMSFWAKNKTREIYAALLVTKFIWGIAAIAALLLSLGSGYPLLFAFIALFGIFISAWSYYMFYVGIR